VLNDQTRLLKGELEVALVTSTNSLWERPVECYEWAKKRSASSSVDVDTWTHTTGVSPTGQQRIV
jgi:hypothetical protein